MNDIEMVQGIFPIIAQRLPKNWQRMVFRASYGEDAYSMEYYVRKSNGVFIQCFEMPGVKEDNLLSDFVIMDKMLEGYRRSLDKKDLWWRMTLAVKSPKLSAQSPPCRTKASPSPARPSAARRRRASPAKTGGGNRAIFPSIAASAAWSG